MTELLERETPAGEQERNDPRTLAAPWAISSYNTLKIAIRFGLKKLPPVFIMIMNSYLFEQALCSKEHANSLSFYRQTTVFEIMKRSVIHNAVERVWTFCFRL